MYDQSVNPLNYYYRIIAGGKAAYTLTDKLGDKQLSSVGLHGVLTLEKEAHVIKAPDTEEEPQKRGCQHILLFTVIHYRYQNKTLKSIRGGGVYQIYQTRPDEKLGRWRKLRTNRAPPN